MVTLMRGTETGEGPDGRRGVPSLAGCPVHDLKERLRSAGLRPTRQRVALGWLLFGRGDRHLSAETLFDEAQRARVPVSLATIYNTLNQFTQVGLLREIAIDGSRTYFDTNTSEHHHFFIEGGDGLLDIPAREVSVTNLPEPPEGMEICRVEVVVRLRKKTN
ncbi:MAG: transcriptional repressor [Rhizobiales bacterium PAR1]|nr:MAG: transcriptional repressor [Rhizobiales bacterium PAR1]